MLAAGMDRWQAEGMLELFGWIREGGADTVTSTVRELTGAEPQALDDWLAESRAIFLEPRGL
jgi:NAD(P)H dehydrogenase (quinone)